MRANFDFIIFPECQQGLKENAGGVHTRYNYLLLYKYSTQKFAVILKQSFYYYLCAYSPAI